MPFEAKRLRVQVPCRVADSIVVFTPHGWTDYVATQLHARCYTPTIWACLWHGHSDIPICPGGSCGHVASIPGHVGPLDPIEVLLHPDQLPQFRRQLEFEQAAIDEVVSHKGEIESQLEKLGAIEQELGKN